MKKVSKDIMAPEDKNHKLIDFIEMLQQELSCIELEYQHKAIINFYSFENYGEYEVGCEIFYYRELSEQEIKINTERAKKWHKEKIQKELEEYQRLKTKLENFNGNFDDYE